MRALFPAILSLMVLLLPRISLACFDTFLFLERSSMVYPRGMLVFDMNGEYSINDVSSGQMDSLAGGINSYYGISRRLSAQVGIGSSDKPRDEMGVDEYGMRVVGNVFRNLGGFYNLDLIVEHVGTFREPQADFEFSAPNIFYTGSFAFVVHPVVAVGPGSPAGLRGHGGVFFLAGDSGVVGLGTEYASNQSSSNLLNRLVQGEAASSLFLGARIGSRVYVQDELIKGWGADTRDYGMALTLKVGAAGVHGQRGLAGD